MINYYVLIAFFIPPLIAAIHHYWPRNEEELYHHRHRLLTYDMQKRGLNALQQLQELKFREMMAELRYRASAKTIENPRRFRFWIDEIAKEIADRVAVHDRGTAMGFLKVVGKQPAELLLDDDAIKAIHNAARTIRAVRPTLDTHKKNSVI